MNETMSVQELTARDPFPLTWQRVKSGVTVGELTQLLEEGILQRSDIVRIIPQRTLERRRANQEPLKIDEIDGIARFWRLREHARRVFEDAALASQWLDTANPALGGERPIDMARSEIGAREVEGVLGRLEHGIYG